MSSEPRLLSEESYRGIVMDSCIPIVELPYIPTKPTPSEIVAIKEGDTVARKEVVLYASWYVVLWRLVWWMPYHVILLTFTLLVLIVYGWEPAKVVYDDWRMYFR
jgi:hypothetical protein